MTLDYRSRRNYHG